MKSRRRRSLETAGWSRMMDAREGVTYTGLSMVELEHPARCGWRAPMVAANHQREGALVLLGSFVARSHNRRELTKVRR